MAQPSMLVPGDYQVQSDAIAKKRALLDQLVKQSQLGQGQMVGNVYVPPNWTSALADLGSTAVQLYGNDKLDQQQAEANKANQEGLGKAVQNYMKTRDGYEQATPLTQITPDGSTGAPLMEQVKGDPRKAMIEAITSGYGPLQEIGMAELRAMPKQQMTPKDIYALAGEGKYTPASVQKAALSGDLTLLKPLGKTHSVNGQLVSVGENDDGGVRNLGDFRDRFGDVGQVAIGQNGQPIMGQKNSGTGEVKFAPGGTTVNVDTGQKGAAAFSVKANEAIVKDLETSKANAEKALGSFQAFQNAAQAVKDLPGGLTTTPLYQAKRVLAMFGADDPSIQSTEQVNQALKTAILDNAHVFGTGNGFTDKDREELAKIVGADVSLSPQTLNYVINKGLANSWNTMQGHRLSLAKAKNLEGADPNVLKMFETQSPRNYSLPSDRVTMDETTGLLTPVGGAGENRQKTQQGSRNLTKEEEARYQYLLNKHGRK